MCRWQVRLFLVEKMKPKLFGFKNEMEREIRKCLTFVTRGECRRVELCSRKFILNFNQTNLESQVKSERFLLNKPIKWVNRRVKTEAKNWSSSGRVPCYQRWRRRIRTRRWWRLCNKGVCIWDDENARIVVSQFNDSLLTNVNSRIDGVIKDLAELKSSLQFTQKDVEDLKPVTKQMTKIVLRLTKDFSQTCNFRTEKWVSAAIELVRSEKKSWDLLVEKRA